MKRFFYVLLRMLLAYLCIGLVAALFHYAIGYINFVRLANGLSHWGLLTSCVGWLAILYSVLLWPAIVFGDLSMGNNLLLEGLILAIALVIIIYNLVKAFKKKLN